MQFQDFLIGYQIKYLYNAWFLAFEVLNFIVLFLHNVHLYTLFNFNFKRIIYILTYFLVFIYFFSNIKVYLKINLYIFNMKKLNKYQIQKWLNNPILRQVSKEVEIIDDEIKEFADELIEMMWEFDGVWLAAPQVWKNIRMIAVTQWSVKWNKWDLLKQQVMINPVITEKSSDLEIDEEGCLSLPGMKWDVARSKDIKVKYIDLNWKEKNIVLSWINARIVQHEMDHLDWILFADKIIKKDPVKLDKFIKL